MPAAKNNTREYRVWDQVEEEALRLGVRKHGLGAWERIRTDADFSVLQSRSGVQLKDKFRNLIKFRHITVDETQQLQPKTSGPWHRKYATAANGGSNGRASARAAPSSDSRSGSAHGGARKMARSSRRKQSVSRRAADNDDDEEEDEEEAAAVEAQMAAELGSDAEEGSKRAPRRKSARAAATNRRNYLEVEQALDADTGADDGDQVGDDDARDDGTPRRHKRRRVMAGQQDSGRTGVLDCRRHDAHGHTAMPAGGAAAGNSANGSEHTDFEEETYVFDCPCGITYDDGELMIECEECKAWAHTACLQAHMAMDPYHNSFNIKNYICRRCQQWQRAAGNNTNESDSQSPADEQQQSPHNPGAGSSPYSGGYTHEQGAAAAGGGFLWGPAAGASAYAEDGQGQHGGEGKDMVDIDPVLTLILQGSLWVKRKKRGARLGRWDGPVRQGWCSGFVDWDYMSAKQQQAASALGMSSKDGRVRRHPSAIRPGHPKWQQEEGQQGQEDDSGDDVPLQKPIRRTGPHARSTLTDSILVRSLLAHGTSNASDGPSRAISTVPRHLSGFTAGPSTTIARTTARKGAFPRSSGVDQDLHKRMGGMVRLPKPSRDQASMYLSDDDLGADAGDAVDAMLSVGLPPASPQHISQELFERVDREDEAAAGQQLHGGEGPGHVDGKAGRGGRRWSRHQQQASHDLDELDEASRHTLDSLLLSSLTAGPSSTAHTASGNARADLLSASLTPFMHAALGLNPNAWPFAGLQSGTPPPSDLLQAPGSSGNRAGTTRRPGLGPSRLGQDIPPDVSLALHIAELRPPTPDTYALFRAPTPESMALQSAAALQPGVFPDIGHPQSWPLSRTPPLPDGLLALHHSLATMAALPSTLQPSSLPPSSTAHSGAQVFAGGLASDVSAPLRRGAAAAAAVKVEEELQAVAAVAPTDMSSFFDIDEFVNQGPADEDDEAAAEAMAAMAAAPPAPGMRLQQQQQQQVLQQTLPMQQAQQQQQQQQQQQHLQELWHAGVTAIY